VIGLCLSKSDVFLSLPRPSAKDPATSDFARLATLRRKNPAAVDGKDAGADAAISAQVIKLRGGQRSIDKSLPLVYLNRYEE